MIGLALLGAGRMAKVHAEAISEAGTRLVTVFDVVEAAAHSLASKAGAGVARTAEEALGHPEVRRGSDRDLFGHSCQVRDRGGSSWKSGDVREAAGTYSRRGATMRGRVR